MCVCVCTHVRASVRVRVGACACECVCVALRIQHATGVCVLLHGHLLSFWLHHIFLHYLKWHIFRKRKLLNIKCVFWSHTEHLFKTFLIQRIIKQDIVINMKTSSCKIPVILVGLNKT